jgi:hypothetical protein
VRWVKVLLVLVVVLLGLGVAADRVAVGVAESQVSTRLGDSGTLHGRPEVDIKGFPFLTQAVGGRYDDVRIALTAAELGQPAGTRADVSLHGVHVPLSSVLSRSVRTVPVDRIDGTATLSYSLLSAQLGAGTTLVREGNGLRITRTVEVLGQSFPLTAVGTVSLAGRDIVLHVQKATGVGVQVPSFVLDRAVRLLGLRYRVPALPLGLTLTSVRPAAAGVDVGLGAKNAVLAPQ